MWCSMCHWSWSLSSVQYTHMISYGWRMSSWLDYVWISGMKFISHSIRACIRWSTCLFFTILYFCFLSFNGTCEQLPVWFLSFLTSFSLTSTRTTSINDDEICFNYLWHKLRCIASHILPKKCFIQHFWNENDLKELHYALRSTYKWWIKCRTVNTDARIWILIGRWVWCAIDADTGCRQSWVAGQCQSCRIVLTWANGLTRNGIGHDWSTVLTTSGRWWYGWWCGRIVRCLRLSSRTNCTRLYTCCRSSTRTDWRCCCSSWNRWLCTGCCCWLAIGTTAATITAIAASSQQLKWKVTKLQNVFLFRSKRKAIVGT